MATMDIPATLKQIEKIALECGFTHTGEIDAATIKLRQEVRDACDPKRCKSHGKNWACPPHCGSLEEGESKIRQFSRGLILQTTGNLEKALDWKSMTRIGAEHREHLVLFKERMATEMVCPWLLMGAGGCKNCEQCTCPDSPCLFPEKRTVSLEAMGIYVTELCKANNIPYYYGTNTLTFVGCVLV